MGGGEKTSEVWRCQLASQSQAMALGYKKIIIRSHLSITQYPLVMGKRKKEKERERGRASMEAAWGAHPTGGPSAQKKGQGDCATEEEKTSMVDFQEPFNALKKFFLSV